MKQIDFLPQRYRDKDARRRAGMWRLVVISLFGGLIAAASVAQFTRRAWVQSQVAQIQPMLAQSKSVETQLTQLRDRLSKETAVANLCAAVEMPWPRTQIISTLVQPLGDTVVLESIEMTQKVPSASPQGGFGEQPRQSKESKQDQIAPAERDLQLIRQQLYEKRTAVEIKGVTSQQAYVHAYLQALEESPLVKHVELLDLDSLGQGEAQLRFTALVQIRAPLGLREADRVALGGSER